MFWLIKWAFHSLYNVIFLYDPSFTWIYENVMSIFIYIIDRSMKILYDAHTCDTFIFI